MQQNPAPARGSSKVVIIVAIVVGVLLVGVALVGILAALGIHGVRKYLGNAKEAEGRATAAAIAYDVIRCSERESIDSLDGSNPTTSQMLPVSTAPVPASLDDIAGKKYMSSPADWTSPGWDCIKFTMNTPQYFQYQWVRSSTTEGAVRAVADLDGDHAPDVTFEMPITCTTSPTWKCQAGMLKETR